MVFGFLLLFQVPKVQQRLAKEFSKKLSTEYSISIESQKLKIGILSGLAWEDILIQDTSNDTLIFIEELKITTTDLAFNHFNKIYLKGLQINCIYTDSITDASFYQTFKPLFNKSQGESNLKIDNIWVNGASLCVGKLSDLKYFDNINVYLKEMELAAETSFVLSNLNLDMRNGETHTIAASRFTSSALGTKLNGFNWKSGASEIDLNFVHFLQNDSSSLILNTFKVNKLATNGLFAAWPSSLNLQMEAVVSLVNNKLSTENFHISTENGSQVKGNLVLTNIHNLKSFAYKLNTQVVNIKKDEWLWLESLFEYNYLLQSLGDIEANLNLEGSLTNVDLQLELASNEGSLSTDIYISKPDSTNAPFYEGTIFLDQFNLAAFVTNYQVSTIVANLSVNGSGLDLASFDTDIVGEISSIELGSYTYENINLNGRLQADYFKGKALVLDENLEVDFSGEVDFSKQKPVMDFTADVIHANLVELNWYDKEPVANLSALIEMNLVGDKLSNIEGFLGVYFSELETENNFYHFNDLNFQSLKSSTGNTLTLRSDFANAQLDGQIDIPNLYQSFLAYLSPHFPLIPSAETKHQNFNFSVDVFNSSALTDLFVPQLHLGDGAHIVGEFNTKGKGLDISILSPNLGWGNWLWRDLNLNSKVTKELWKIDLLGSKLDYNLETKFENIEIDQVGTLGGWRYSLAWSSEDSIKFDGIVKGNTSVTQNSIEIDIDESQFYFADTLWTLNDNSSFNYQTNGNLRSNIVLSTKEQLLDINYTKNNKLDELNLFVSDFEFENINPWLAKSMSSLIGKLSGDLKVEDLSTKPKISFNSISNNLIFNNYPFGDLELLISYDKSKDTQLILANVFNGINKTLDISGAYTPSLDSNNVQLYVDVHNFNLKHLEVYMKDVFSDFSGTGIGHLNIYGNIENPKFEGELMVDNMAVEVPYLNINLTALNDSKLTFTNQHINFVDIDFVGVEDENNIGKARLSGELLHHNFTDFSMDLQLETDSLLSLNTDAYRDEAYYGRAIVSGDVAFKGPFSSIEIDINARTEKGTSLFIPLDDKESLEEMSFIQFIEKETTATDSLWSISEVVQSQSGLLLDINFEITEDAEVNIIFDETLGDKITAIGNGFINLGVNTAEEVYMFGDYTLSKGDYLFTLQNFVNKKFEIENGSKLVWDGNPYKAQMDLTALYTINTNINDLSSEYNRKTDVNCSMLMTGDLLQPIINFDITIPKGDDLINRILDERTNTEEKKTQQFLSLLVLNSFMSTDELQSTDVDYLSTTLSTGTEVLSNQLSNWMSQFTDKFDLGFNYHPNQGDTLSNKEFELLLNNMKVNDRITFNGNLGTQPAQNTTRIIGDFKVEYQIKENGKLKFLAFRNLEESFQLQDDATNYTTGVGLYYRDEFDSFPDLWHQFLGMFKRKKSKT